MLNPTELHIPADEFRSLPVPYTGLNGHQSKLATCFVRVEDIPDQLRDWMSVNPRIPNFNKEGDLKGTVAKGIIRTLMEDPEKFALMNQGIHLIADHVEFVKESGGKGVVVIKFVDQSEHGLVNGGHTFRAIRQVAEDPEHPEPWNAYVRLHIMEMKGANSGIIAQIAEGLNRSLQVDNPSLENLRGTFDAIKMQLAGKLGSDQIAYRQGDEGEIDVQQVLTYIGLLNIEQFPDRRTHPHVIFGQPKLVLENFVKDSEKENSGFSRILPRLHEILVLTDLIQREASEQQELARLKVSKGKTQNRVRSAKNKSKPAHFAGGLLGGNIPLGLLYPMLAAFRANISRPAWEEGRLEWLIDPKKLLSATIKEMTQIVRQEFDDNNKKPAEVGRKEAAYRGCYSVMVMELAQHGIVTA